MKNYVFTKFFTSKKLDIVRNEVLQDLNFLKAELLCGDIKSP